MNSWIRATTRFVEEAKDILRKHGYPTEWVEIKKVRKSPSDRLVGSAIQVIAAYDFLAREIERDRTLKALSRFYSLASAYEEMTFLSNVPELENRPVITDRVFSALGTGVKRQRDMKIFGDVRGKQQTVERAKDWEKWKNEAERLKKENPVLAGPRMKSELARKIKSNLALDISIETIRKRI